MTWPDILILIAVILREVRLSMTSLADLLRQCRYKKKKKRRAPKRRRRPKK